MGRVRFGYSATAVAERLGYRGPSGVSHAVRREAPERLRAIAATLEGKLIGCLFTIQALTPIALPLESYGIVVGDIDGNGVLDILVSIATACGSPVGSGYGYQQHVFWGTREGVTTYTGQIAGQGALLRDIDVGDVDADGDLDITGTGPSVVYLCINDQENGTFWRYWVHSFPGSYDFGYGSRFHDPSGLGRSDIYAGGETAELWLMANTGDPPHPEERLVTTLPEPIRGLRMAGLVGGGYGIYINTTAGLYWLLLEESALPQNGFKRGDTNGDESINIADAIFVLGFLFAQGRAPGCLDTADTNDSGKIDIGDAIFLLSHLFAHGGPLKDPFGACGIDPTIDELDCASFPPCE